MTFDPKNPQPEDLVVPPQVLVKMVVAADYASAPAKRD